MKTPYLFEIFFLTFERRNYSLSAIDRPEVFQPRLLLIQVMAPSHISRLGAFFFSPADAVPNKKGTLLKPQEHLAFADVGFILLKTGATL